MLGNNGMTHGHLKSETLPRFDGHDELEPEFEVVSLVNSCPDLSLILPEGNGHRNGGGAYNGKDVVDGFFKSYQKKYSKHIPRSLSLVNFGLGDGNQLIYDVSGSAASPIVNLSPPKGYKGPDSTNNNYVKESKKLFIRSPLRSSHNGSTYQNNQQFFKGIAAGGDRSRIESLASASTSKHPQQSSEGNNNKRSFFRKKNKGVKNGGSSVVPDQGPGPLKRMEHIEYRMDDNFPGTLGFYALYDPTLGLQESDAECWALSIDEEVVAQLNEKEVKRQEHMYEFILTEKHHCLTLALMHHLFLGGLKKSGLSHLSRQFFPGLIELLHVHFNLLRKLRQVQLRHQERNEPLESLTEILHEQFTGDQWELLIRLYGRLCATHAKSLEIFKSEMKNPKFAHLVAQWGKEPLLARKNVPECLLLVAQRITKYPLLIKPLEKTTVHPEEKELISDVLRSSTELISKVNKRVEESQKFAELCQRFDKNSYVAVGKRRIGRDDLLSVSYRRLLFSGQAHVLSSRINEGHHHGGTTTKIDSCHVFILTDSILFMNELSGRFHFAVPPGIVNLKHLIVREKERQPSSFYLVLANDTTKPDLIELSVIHPPFRDMWVDKLRDAISRCEEDIEPDGDGEEEGSSDAADFADVKLTKALDELYEKDSQILSLLRSRTRLIENLRSEKPHHWNTNIFEGKDEILGSISAASNEVQRVITMIDGASNVNRSASCVAEHVSSGAVLGLPKRADTFGGFDSAQRGSLDYYQNLTNNKVLYQMVVQLADVCGELFTQMLPHVTLQAHQSSHQLQRRLEELREAQRRLESEKANWTQELNSEKDKMDKIRAELGAQREALKKEEADVIHQREQLYRKLEALQKQGGIQNAISPVAVLNASEKANSSNPQPARRPIPPAPANQLPLPPQQNPGGSGAGVRQKLPLHLAAFSKGGSPSGVSQNTPIPTSRPPPPLPPHAAPRLGQKVTSPIPPLPLNLSQSGGGGGGGSSEKNGEPKSNSKMRQMLPLQLSESNLKSTSLPRGVGAVGGSRSTSNITAAHQAEVAGNKYGLRSSSTSQMIPHHLVNNVNSGAHASGGVNTESRGFLSNSSGGLYYNKGGGGGGTDHRFTVVPHPSGAPGSGGDYYHRRSGSSPVPISNSASSQDLLDEDKILFL